MCRNYMCTSKEQQRFYYHFYYYYYYYYYQIQKSSIAAKTTFFQPSSTYEISSYIVLLEYVGCVKAKHGNQLQLLFSH